MLYQPPPIFVVDGRKWAQSFVLRWGWIMLRFILLVPVHALRSAMGAEAYQPPVFVAQDRK